MGILALAFISIFDGRLLGPSIYYESCVGGMEEKDEEQFSLWSLEKGSFGNLAGYLDGKKSMDF